jgi:hypothetical protein
MQFVINIYCYIGASQMIDLCSGDVAAYRTAKSARFLLVEDMFKDAIYKLMLAINLYYKAIKGGNTNFRAYKES